MRKNSRGSCELQTMHGAFKKGFEKSDLVKIIQGAYVFMTDSPAKRRFSHRN